MLNHTPGRRFVQRLPYELSQSENHLLTVPREIILPWELSTGFIRENNAPKLAAWYYIMSG
ncbi:MAG: hypothetical protein V7L14_16725 [Nostoc sp.]|uniref:hypothetical protein n=1 Tax=Nostoc sp. TaxID=1180 RepID=UPI002FFBCC2B